MHNPDMSFPRPFGVTQAEQRALVERILREEAEREERILSEANTRRRKEALAEAQAMFFRPGRLFGGH